MNNILIQLKKTGAKIILATTTPTRKERETAPDTQHFNSEIRYYNQRLLEAIGDKVDAVDDLYSVVEGNINEYISDDFLHPSPAGVEILSQQVAKSIRETKTDNNSDKTWDSIISEKATDEIQENKFWGFL